jgi:hypothetical protein
MRQKKPSLLPSHPQPWPNANKNICLERKTAEGMIFAALAKNAIKMWGLNILLRFLDKCESSN